MRSNRRFALLLVGTACLLFGARLGLAAPSSVHDAQARQILEAAGAKGGLVVHVGCRDGRLTAALRAGDAYLVHGLARDAKNVAQARRHVQSRGLYGPVSVQHWPGGRLPYTDNLVNLIVVEESVNVSRAEMMRVLVPNGVACVTRDGRWTKTVKPRPDNIDEWTHFLHNPTNNAVAQDEVVAPPHHMQWVGDPMWARSHDHLATISAVVSSGGRLFYIADEGLTASVAFPVRWRLVARDAFNGVVLWKKPIGPWEGHLRGFRTGPAELPRRLVAIGDRVYVTLGYGKPVTALSAAAGDVVMTYDGTKGALEILYDRGVLYVVVGQRDPDAMAEAIQHRMETPPPRHMRLLAVDADKGDILWEKADASTSELMPLTLAVAEGRAFFQNPDAIVCLDAESGEQQWRARRPISRNRWAWSTPTLVVYDGVLLSADRAADSAVAKEPIDVEGVQWTVSSAGGEAPQGQIMAFSAESGRKLWNCPCRETYNAPPDVFVTKGLVWTGDVVRARDPGITVARDPRTGLIRKERPADREYFIPGMGHHRCYRNKATSEYLLMGRSGVEFIDATTGAAVADHWIRGACQYGIVPCNGLLYVPSHSCACFVNSKLNGFNALAPRRKSSRPHADQAARLERGPAFGQPCPATSARQATAWPTYRHDAARSGRTDAAVPSSPNQTWTLKLGGKLSSLVMADGKVFVASIDAHTVHALDADGGERVWSFTADGRVDSPPTICEGRALFGSADGHVYCVRVSDGALIWRFRVAPEDRYVFAYGQLESAWPVHGSVLVSDGAVYAAAGRSSFLDGGIYLCRLDVKTGKLLSQTCLDSRDPETGQEPKDKVRGTDMPGALPDVLSSDGQFVYMRHTRFDREIRPLEPDVPHMFSPAGYLDDSWWHRTYWQVSTAMTNGWGRWPNAGNQNPAGRLLVQDGPAIYGFARLNQYARHGSHVGLRERYLPWPRPGSRSWDPGNTRYYLYAHEPGAMTADQKHTGPRSNERVQTKWTRQVPILVRAMIETRVADRKALIIAGPPDYLTADEDGRTDPDFEKAERAFTGGDGGLLWVVAAADGKRLAEVTLASSPVFDGLIAGGNSLYLSTLAGEVICLGPD